MSPFENPQARTSEREISSSEQEYEETMTQILTLFEQLQNLCSQNETAKTLFASADNWSMPLTKRMGFLQDILGNEGINTTTKNELTSRTLTHLHILCDTLEKQAREGKYATTEPVKKAKEDLNQIFLDLLPS